MPQSKKSILSSLIILGTVLMISELMLQGLSLAVPRVRRLLSPPASSLRNEVRGEKRNSRNLELNPWESRNPFLPSQATVVILGDSQTWGTGVAREDAWPAELERLIKKKIYNGAWPGHGPAHPLLFLQDALRLKPEIIIEAFYMGNDLFDSYALVYNGGRLAHLKSTDQAVLKAIQDAEEVGSLSEKIGKLFRMGEKKPLEKNTLRSFLSRYSRLYGLFRGLKRIFIKKLLPELKIEPGWDILKKRAEQKKGYCEIFAPGKLQTIFTPRYRFCALNLRDPRIKEGARISLEAIRAMSEKAEKKGIEFWVLILPTKESVFKEAVEGGSGTIPRLYRKLISSEELFLSEMKAFLDQNKIRYGDAAPFLRRCLQSGESLYLAGANGHPNAAGHRAIARFVRQALKNSGGEEAPEKSQKPAPLIKKSLFEARGRI